MKHRDLTEAEKRALEAVGIFDPKIVEWRLSHHPGGPYWEPLIEGIGADEITRFRGWWREGESAEDIKWEEA